MVKRPPGEALPRGMRNAAVLCLSLAALVGFFSASQAASLANLSAVRESANRPAPKLPFVADPKLAEKQQEAEIAAYVAAVEPMKTAGGLTLGALAICCGLMFVSAARILRPAGLPREGMRGLLSGSAMVAAMLTAINGAQLTVVARAVGAAVGKVLAESEPYRSDPSYANVPGLVSTSAGVVAVVLTALFAGTLMWLSVYFRSEKVKKIVAFRDGQAGS